MSPAGGLDGVLRLVATCGLGLEAILLEELRQLGFGQAVAEKGAVVFAGDLADVYRTNWLLRTANRVLIELVRFPAADGEALWAGGRAAVLGPLGELLEPGRSFAIRATTSASAVRDTRWAALRLKDGIVDAQRERFGARASVERETPDLPLRLRLHRDQATLLLDTSGEPLDRRGYRVQTTLAPVREQLAAACVLAAGWDGKGPVVDPMCGSGTFLIEAAWIALGRAPAARRAAAGLRFACERFPGFDPAAFARVRAAPLPAPGPSVRLLGNDRSPAALAAARQNLERAGLLERAELRQGDAFDLEPPAGGPGLLCVNPPYGERLAEEEAQWRALGDLLKRRFAGWKAVVLAGGASRGKHIGLRPRRKLPVWNGPLEARILVFDLF